MGGWVGGLLPDDFPEGNLGGFSRGSKRFIGVLSGSRGTLGPRVDGAGGKGERSSHPLGNGRLGASPLVQFEEIQAGDAVCEHGVELVICTHADHGGDDRACRRSREHARENPLVKESLDKPHVIETQTSPARQEESRTTKRMTGLVEKGELDICANVIHARIYIADEIEGFHHHFQIPLDNLLGARVRMLVESFVQQAELIAGDTALFLRRGWVVGWVGGGEDGGLNELPKDLLEGQT